MTVVALTLVGSTTRAPSAPPASAQAEPDLILHDAIVITMDTDRPSASAVAVTGDRIVMVGSDEEVLALAGPATTVVDLGSLTLLPGFIDSHSHWIGDRELYGVSSAAEAIQRALEGGWTSINELFVNQDRLDELQALDADGQLRVRVNGYLPVNYGSDQKFGMWFKDYTPGQQLGPLLRLAGVKFFIDGCAETMLLSEPHEDTGELGSFYWRRGELNRLVRRVHEAGWQIAAHACGDGAIDRMLDALEQAFDGSPGRPFRARIEHLIVLRDDQLKRMRRLGVSPSFQLTFVDSTDAKVLRKIVGPDRLDLLGRWRDLMSDPRLHAMGSTDSPYGWASELDTTTAMQALVQGTAKIGERGVDPPWWMRDDRLTLEQGLEALTTAGAYGIFAEDDLGAITPGMLADLVVLSKDPHDVPLKRLTRIDVLMVFVGGKLEICAPGYEGLCPADPTPAAVFVNGPDA